MDRRAEKIKAEEAGHVGSEKAVPGRKKTCGWGSRTWMWVVWMEEGVDRDGERGRRCVQREGGWRGSG